MDLKERIKQNLSQSSLLQLATSLQGQPWICTVYFVADKELNLYWLSWPERRHSQEIATNNNVAVTVAVKHDIPVIGIQAEGRAEVVADEAEAVKILDVYVKKYGAGKDFVKNYRTGTNHHQLYKFTPSKYVLFDEKNFTGEETHQELVL